MFLVLAELTVVIEQAVLVDGKRPNLLRKRHSAGAADSDDPAARFAVFDLVNGMIHSPDLRSFPRAQS
jgi:hypothetical protein